MAIVNFGAGEPKAGWRPDYVGEVALAWVRWKTRVEL